MKTILISLALTLAVITDLAPADSFAFSDAVTGQITFTTRPPFAGVVYFKDEAAAPVAASLDQLNKQFSSKMVVVSPGSSVRFINSDPFDHNIFANDLVSQVQFDVGLIPASEDASIESDWVGDSLVRVGCKIHPKMRSYIANIQSSHYTVIEFDTHVTEYRFSLEGVPGQITDLRLLLPGHSALDVELKPGQEREVEILKRGMVVGSLSVAR